MGPYCHTVLIPACERPALQTLLAVFPVPQPFPAVCWLAQRLRQVSRRGSFPRSNSQLPQRCSRLVHVISEPPPAGTGVRGHEARLAAVRLRSRTETHSSPPPVDAALQQRAQVGSSANRRPGGALASRSRKHPRPPEILKFNLPSSRLSFLFIFLVAGAAMINLDPCFHFSRL